MPTFPLSRADSLAGPLSGTRWVVPTAKTTLELSYRASGLYVITMFVRISTLWLYLALTTVMDYKASRSHETIVLQMASDDIVLWTPVYVGSIGC